MIKLFQFEKLDQLVIFYFAGKTDNQIPFSKLQINIVFRNLYDCGDSVPSEF